MIVRSRANVPALESLLPRQARVLLIFSLMLLLVLAGCAAGKKWKYLPASKAEERSVYVVTHGWHTGIVLSKGDLGPELGFVQDFLIPGQYYEFGWGEAEFYQADKVTAPIFLKAVLWRNPSVMHVVSLPAPPATFYSGKGVIELNMSQAGLQHLRDRLRASFEFDQQNRPYPLKGRPTGENRFFKGEDYYLITNTCNRWTAKMLQSGGVPMDTVFTLRAASVVRQVNEAKKEYLRLRRSGGVTGAALNKKAPLPSLAGGKNFNFNQPSLVCFLS
ncbi:DUF2459 domain-containing protein [Citrifermentans pelophilum]|uniref:DUF2459 domain-containing protein n=1 Tax=Geoanaerobacter pelophilus TaxID=60036 RepID=UPI001F48922C|nr:DUF2459 domain-containing protein [Geoanaerobacter pelophilus]